MPHVTIYAIVLIQCLQTFINCFSSTIGQYIYKFYLEAYSNSSNQTLNYTATRPLSVFNHNLLTFINIDSNETNHCLQENFTPDKDAQAWAQQRSADLFFRTNLVSSCPVIVMTYVLGLCTPKLGKRLVLMFPLIGASIQISIWLFIIYFHLSDYWWYVAAFIIGLSGSGGLFGLTLNLIITENTLESERSSLFVRLNAIQTTIGALATLGIGYYIAWRGFTDLYWCALLLLFVSMIVVMIYFTKVDDFSLNERTHLLSMHRDEFSLQSTSKCSQFFNVCTGFYSNKRSKKKTLSLFLTLFSNIFYVLAVTAFAPFLWFLLNAPFCWTSKDIGNYSALSAVSSAILGFIGVQLMTYMGASDAAICATSHLCLILTSVWNAFSCYSWQLYAGLVVNSFTGYQGTLTLPMMSKWLEPHEQNNVFTLVTEINTILSTFGSSFYNWLYARTVVHYRTLTLFIAAGLSVISFLLNLCLIFVTRNMSEDSRLALSATDTETALLRSETDTLQCVDDLTDLTYSSETNSAYDNNTQEAMESTNNGVFVVA